MFLSVFGSLLNLRSILPERNHGTIQTRGYRNLTRRVGLGFQKRFFPSRHDIAPRFD
jgi:hypothetical protein